MELSQERKYDAVDGKIVNRATGKPIPDDEPIMIFRAKDINSINTLIFYQSLCVNEVHKDVIQGRIDEFFAFQDRFYDTVTEPDSDKSCLPSK